MHVYHKLHIYDFVDEFKVVLVDTNHKLHTHSIRDDFTFVLVEKDNIFHIYDILDELSICRWRELTNSYSPCTFSNNNLFEGEHKHHN